VSERLRPEDVARGDDAAVAERGDVVPHVNPSVI